ncbi:MAG: hypothetical protein ACOVOQ_10010 [Flavobacterium sp.]|jgi:hypothetical protein
MIQLSVRWLKFGSFGFAKGRLVCRAIPNVPNVRLAKIVLKNVRWKKNKKLRVGLSVGLPVVELKYGLYVVHLSRWFVYAIRFKFGSVCRLWNGRPTIGYNGLRIGDGGAFGKRQPNICTNAQ